MGAHSQALGPCFQYLHVSAGKSHPAYRANYHQYADDSFTSLFLAVQVKLSRFYSVWRLWGSQWERSYSNVILFFPEDLTSFLTRDLVSGLNRWPRPFMCLFINIFPASYHLYDILKNRKHWNNWSVAKQAISVKTPEEYYKTVSRNPSRTQLDSLWAVSSPHKSVIC